MARLTLPAPPFWPLSGLEHPPGGETLGHVIARVGAALERLAVAHPDQDLVIVMHGGAIRAAVAHALRIAPDTALLMSVQNLALTRLERHPQAWRVVCVNELPGY
jgi:alpha-ribazole phosphatase